MEMLFHTYNLILDYFILLYLLQAMHFTVFPTRTLFTQLYIIYIQYDLFLDRICIISSQKVNLI